MRHRIDGRKLGRTSAHRKAMFANMAASLILHDRIETTLPKAKELKSIADRLVTMGKKKNLAALRRAAGFVRNKEAVKKLFGELSLRFADRNGGYTRILKLGSRHGDNAPMAVIEYLSSPHKLAKESEKKEKKEKQKKGLVSKLAQKIHDKKAVSSKAAGDVDTKHKRSSPTHKAVRGD